jgi:starch phosphorylase
MLYDKELFKKLFTHKVHAMWGRELSELTKVEKYQTFASVVRDYISENWIKTNRAYMKNQEKQIYYFSIEFLMGRLLNSNIINCGIRDFCAEALKDLGLDINEIIDEEKDAGLGNGGLGRLAACFIDSIASLGLAGHGCGIRYKNGLFEQRIVDCQQVELPDNWLKNGFAWEFRKPDKSVEVRFGGNAYMRETQSGMGLELVHENYTSISAVPYDVPIVGYKNHTVNTLRLWSAEYMLDLDVSDNTMEDIAKKMRYKHMVQRITKMLYPDDSTYEGKLLRLTQEYFFVSAGVQSIIRHYKRTGADLRDLGKKIGIHINDTHPAMAVAELMRILVDEEGMEWFAAWKVTTEVCAYTNHTILPEALETWQIDMFRSTVPRIYMIIDEINRRLLEEVRRRYPDDEERVRQMSIIQDGCVHMARLAIVGSHSVNGVAKIHTDILKDHTLHVFHEYYPYKFNNKTNGITHRRWLIGANPELAKLIDNTITPSWQRRPSQLINLLDYADDKSFQEKFAVIKRACKTRLANYIKEKNGVIVDPASIFDIQVKRIHSYKRQLMNILHIMDLYRELKAHPNMEYTPRTFIFAGKAAAAYTIAKMTIKLINVVAQRINNDPSIKGKLKVVFLENFSVSLGEIVYPAANISEQISTASKEASGTGNMKFMMNGAITLGTMDGANVEIHEAVGDENCVIFGLRANEVIDYYAKGNYSAWDIYHQNDRIRSLLDLLIDGTFGDYTEDFRMLYDYLLYENDEFFILKDLPAYADAHKEIGRRYRHRSDWLRSSIINIAHSGIFSSDRTISEYAKDIWHIKPVKVE